MCHAHQGDAPSKSADSFDVHIRLGGTLPEKLGRLQCTTPGNYIYRVCCINAVLASARSARVSVRADNWRSSRTWSNHARLPTNHMLPRKSEPNLAQPAAMCSCYLRTERKRRTATALHLSENHANQRDRAKKLGPVFSEKKGASKVRVPFILLVQLLRARKQLPSLRTPSRQH